MSLYCIKLGMPSDASSILRIDTQKDIATTFGIVSGEKNKWQGGVLLNNGMIYAIPSNAKHILCIDTSISAVDGGNDYSLLGNLPPTKDKWQGIYFQLARTKSISLFVSSLLDSLFCSGGFVGLDNSIYCIPENFDKVMRVSPNHKMEKVSFL